MKVRERKFRTVYDGRFLDDGTLELTMMFNYGNQLCATDATRFGASGAAMFWLRNTQEEEQRHEELIHFGFSHRTKRSVSGPSVVYRLADREAGTTKTASWN